MPDNKTFLDTNILVYAYDNSADRKHDIARERLLELWDSGRGLISTQVMQEFFVTVTRKIPSPMDAGAAQAIIRDLCTWEVVMIAGDDIVEGIDLAIKHHLSFWDAMILETALNGGASLLLSEDLTHGRTIDGLTIQNPFL